MKTPIYIERFISVGEKEIEVTYTFEYEPGSPATYTNPEDPGEMSLANKEYLKEEPGFLTAMNNRELREFLLESAGLDDDAEQGAWEELSDGLYEGPDNREDYMEAWAEQALEEQWDAIEQHEKD